MRGMRLLIVWLFVAMPASAEEISESADQALWCASAIQVLDMLGVYPPEAHSSAALTRRWSRIAFEAFDKAGFTDEYVDALIASYMDEASMQVPDYLVSSDEAALRFDLNTCLEP